MSPGQTAERVYKLLKAQIMNGERRPGERLDPARLARELNASTTPVRDALHQLLGEHMVHAFPLEGFKVPVLSETGLRDLYLWMHDVLRIVLGNGRRNARSEGSPTLIADDVIDATARLFEAITGTLGTSEHRRAVGQANDRLNLTRIIETAVLSDVTAEVEDMITLWNEQDWSELRTALQRYHRRRLSALPALGAAIARRAI